MQWEHKSLYKQIVQVTGVSGKQMPVLKALKDNPTEDAVSMTLAKLRKKARTGDVRAQCVLGFLSCVGYAGKLGKKKLYGSAVGRLDGPYGRGKTLLYAIGDDYYPVRGPHQDLEEAAYWFRRSAVHGYAPAQVMYGDCLFSGEGVEANISIAVSYYLKAADQGNAMATRRLGDCAYLGVGLPQDAGKAAKYFQKAARLGCRDALWRLGDLYYQGEGVEQNLVLAEVFYEEAAEVGVASAMCMIGDMYYYGVHSALTEKKDPDVSADIQQDVITADQASTSTQNNINTGTQTENYVKAAKWYKKAARREDEWGLYALGMCFYLGRGVAQSYKKAVKYFSRSAAYGCPDALWHLASCYYNGIGTKKNKKKAYKYYRAAVEMYGIYGD